MELLLTKDKAVLGYQIFSGTGVPVLLIHGAYLDSNAWIPQQPALKGRSYAAVDLRGHGTSEKTQEPYKVAQLANDMQQLLAHLDWNKVVVVGHSLGGMVAQALALQIPEQIQQLILVDTSYGVRSRWWESLLTDLTWPLLYATPITWQARLFANQMGKHSAQVKSYVQKVITAHAQDAANYRAIWKAVLDFNGYQNLSKIACPTTILVGALNRQTHAQARVMQAQIPHAKLVVVPHAGHMVPWDNPSVLNDLLTQNEQSPTR